MHGCKYRYVNHLFFTNALSALCLNKLLTLVHGHCGPWTYKCSSTPIYSYLTPSDENSQILTKSHTISHNPHNPPCKPCTPCTPCTPTHTISHNLIKANKILHNPQNKTKSYNILQNLTPSTPSHTISHHLTKSHKISQNNTKYHKILQNLTPSTPSHTISQNLTK